MPLDDVDGSAELEFDEIYRRAGPELSAIPWADQAAHPALVQWLDRQRNLTGVASLVVGCGVGDDAEELARRGSVVTAFDVSPRAIGLCRQRFPASTVDYLVADLFAAPAHWSRAFERVVEIRTLQSLPVSRRQEAIRAIADWVAPGGLVFVRCAAREESEPLGSRPWPVSRRELGDFTRAGLKEVHFAESVAEGSRGRAFTAIYQRSSVGPGC